MKIRGNAGFTIVELIVVIIILGILAAVALPRFMDATEKAHDSHVLATKGALQEGIALLNSQWRVNGNSEGDPENDVDGFGDGKMDVNQSGWAVGSGVDAAAGGTAEQTNPDMSEVKCKEIFDGILQTTAEPSVVKGTVTFEALASEASWAATFETKACKWTYLDDLTAPQFNPVGPREITYDALTGKVSSNVTRFQEEGL